MSIKTIIGNKVKSGTYTIVPKDVAAKQLEPNSAFFLKDKNDFLYRLIIEHDSCPTNPRLEDNICTIMGDPEIADEGAATTREEMDKILETGVYYKKIFMYEHSGRTISLNPFGDPWDSGCVGYIYVSQNKLKEEGFDPFDKDLVAKIMDAEIEEYKNYLTDEVYTFAIYRAVTGVKQNEPWAHAEYTPNDILFDEFYRPVFYGDNFAENGLIKEIPEDLEFVEQILTENDEDDQIKIQVRGGYIRAMPSNNPDWPGIWVEFVRDNEPEDTISRPQILFEQTEDEESGEARILIWENPKEEDSTQEVEFKAPQKTQYESPEIKIYEVKQR